MIKKHKTLVFTVVYPQASRYFTDFFNSVFNQEDKDFEFLIIEDGIDVSSQIVAKGITTIRIPVPDNCPIVKNREIALEYAIDNNFDYLISLDCDDIYTPTKISFIKEKLCDSDIVVHDMAVISEVGEITYKSFINNRLDNTNKVYFNDILTKNFIGFGNAGYRVKALNSCIPVPKDIIAVDWYIASCMLLSGASLVYYDVILSYYRQHGNNCANVLEYNCNVLFKEITTKIKHYNALIARFSGNVEIIGIIENEMENLKQIKKRLEDLNEHAVPELTGVIKPLYWWDIINHIS